MALKDFHLTIEDGVQLYLLDYIRYIDLFTVTDAISQEGIAGALGIRRSHVSSALKNLKKKDLLIENLLHFEGSTRKKKAYFLTDVGLHNARKIRSLITDTKVKLRKEDGSEHDTTVGKASEHLEHAYSLLQLVCNIDEDRVLDSMSISEPEKTLKKTKQVSPKMLGPSKSVPKLRRFLGRHSELARVREWLASVDTQTIVIHGIAGIGKTTLAARVAQDSYDTLNILWYRVHSWDNLRNILTALSEYLEQLGRQRLSVYLSEHQQVVLGELSSPLKSDLDAANALLIFDDLHESNEQMLGFMSLLQEILDDIDNVKMLVVSRKLIPFYDRKKVAIEKVVREMKLEGLDEGSAKELLEPRISDESLFKKIYESTEGHPLFLELIESKGATEGLLIDQHELGLYLRDEIFSSLSERERSILGMISTFRYPCPLDALFEMDQMLSRDVLEDLLRRNLIKECDGQYDIHALLREFFYNGLPPITRTEYHLKIGRYYGAKEGDKETLEALHHLILAKEFGSAAEVALKHGEQLIKNGFHQEFLHISKVLGDQGIEADLKTTFFLLRGHSHGVQGQWDSALKDYTVSLDSAKSVGHADDMANAYNSIGTIYYRKGDWGKAFDYYHLGLDLLSDEGDRKVLAKILSNIALIHWEKEEWDKAIDYTSKNLTISRGIEDVAGEARSYNNLGIIYWSMAEPDLSIENYEKALALSLELGDKRTVAIIYNNLGEAFRSKGENERAMEYFKRSLELSKELGFNWQMAEVYRNLGQMIDEPEKARYYLALSLEIYENLGAEKEVSRVKEIIEKY